MSVWWQMVVSPVPSTATGAVSLAQPAARGTQGAGGMNPCFGEGLNIHIHAIIKHGTI